LAVITGNPFEGMTERLVFNLGGKQDVAAVNRPIVPEDRLPGPSAADTSATRTREKTDWAFIGLMLFTAVLFLRPQDTIRALRPLHLAELTALAALGALIAGRLGRGLPATRLTPELVGVVGLGGVILATAPFSVWMGGAVGTFTELFAKVMLIFILMVNTLSSPKRVEQFIWLIVIASGYLAFRAVFDYARGINLIENGRVQGAVGGMFKNPNDLALNMVGVLPLAVALAMRPIAAVRRLAALACAAFMLGAVIASHSRSGTVGLFAMAVVLLVQVARRRPGLGVAIVVAVMMAMPLAPSSYWDRVSSITDGSRDETGSREARRTLLRESFRAFTENPFTGVGAGMFMVYKPDAREQAWREAHNVLLQVAAELGIPGLLVFGFLLVAAVRAPMQTRRLLNATAPGGRHTRKRRASRQPTTAGRSDADALTTPERQMLDAHCGAIIAAVVGWFACALFASVAYHWTFYYLLALAVAPRDIVAARVHLSRVRPRARALAPAAAGSPV
jgi:O-antigen ligase